MTKKVSFYVCYRNPLLTQASVPSEPHIANEAKQSDDGSEARLAEMFQKRPLWSLTALKASLQEPGDVKNLHRFVLVWSNQSHTVS